MSDALARLRALRTPWTRERLALALGVWLAFAVVRASLSWLASWQASGAVPGAANGTRILAFQVALALLWTALAPAVAAWGAAWRARPTVVRLVAALAGVVAACALDALVRRATLIALGTPAAVPFRTTILYFADMNLVAYTGIASVSAALSAHDVLVRRTRRSLTLRTQLAEARLGCLTAQLQPHFLFNALGAVTELAHEAPSAAALTLRRIAGLLRAALSDRAGEVTLGEELEALGPYLEIQRLRFADWLAIDVRVADDARDLLVPRLVLQPLVENAIKHGLTRRTGPGRLTIEGERAGGTLRLAVRDDGAGMRAGEGLRPGIGLSNVAARLAALPGGAGVVELRAAPGGGAIAELRLPVRGAGARLPDESREPWVEAGTGPGAALLRAHPLLAILLGWLLWGLVSAQQSIAWLAMWGTPSRAAIRHLFWSDLAGAGLWALLTPVVVLVATGGGEAVRGRLTTIVAAGPVIALAHAAAWHALAHGDSAFWTTMAGATVSDCLIFALVVALARYRGLLARQAAHAVEEERLRSALAEAELERTEAAVRPGALVARLERLADEVIRAPAATERALARLAGELRELLDAARPVAEEARLPASLAGMAR